jgi:hypothetical protein
MIACVYRMSKTNVGDKVCCPADYLDLGDVVKIDVAQLEDRPNHEILRDADRIVLGGGGVFYFEKSVARLIDEHGHKTVVWGAGANRHGSEIQTYPDNLHKCALVGLRDNCPEWVPCVSCLSALFDKYGDRHDEVNELVIYEHKSFPILLECGGWPRLKNNATLHEALQFISGGRVVVTNSYHGAYWAMLLGKRTIVYQPFSSKFHRMKWQPPIAYTLEELREDVRSAHRKDEGDRLEAARERTARFYERVLQVFGRTT